MPFDVAGVKREVTVAIMPDAMNECLVGTNFGRLFDAIHDPNENLLYLRKERKIVPLQVATLGVTGRLDIAAVGLAYVSEDERERINRLVRRLAPKTNQSIGKT